MNERSKNILITGVSTGIGFGAARELVSRGYRIFGSVRNNEDGERVVAKLGTGFTPLIFDVTDQKSIDVATSELKNLIADEGLGCLINNAGIALGGPLQYQSMSDIISQFDVNVFGILRVTKAFLPLLGASENSPYAPGRIINISSVGGKIAAPFVGAYAGTKHAVEGISGSLRRELLLFGIEVVIVGPGPVQTPIWEKGIDPAPYKETEYGRILGRFSKGARKSAQNGLKIDFLGKKIADIVETKKPKIRYAFAPKKFFSWTIPRLLPDRVIDIIIRRQLMG